jgi:hypothetical protein
MEHLNPIGQWIQPFLGDIALAIVAALLVIYGNDINRVVKRAVGKKPLVIRFLAFVALCTIGYGFLTVNITQWLAKGMARIPLAYLPIAVLLSFIALAMLAERKNQV